MTGRGRKKEPRQNNSYSPFKAEKWQDKARSLGWLEEDIRAIESILSTGQDPCVVSSVERSKIILMTVDSRQKGHYWAWNKVDYPEPSFSKPKTTVEDHWCPVHGRRCDPDENGCGQERTVFYDICDCPTRGHFHDCDAYLWQQEPAIARETPDLTVDLVKIVPKKHREKYGPVQMRLDLEKH